MCILCGTQVSAQISLADAYASTSGAGHLFKWVAHTLAHLCELAEIEVEAKPAIAAAQAEVASALKEAVACQKEVTLAGRGDAVVA
jgi:hypothetical protein